MQCRKGKINWSLSITCEKIAHSLHHKEDSDESQFTVSFEVESLLFFTSGHYDCKKNIPRRWKGETNSLFYKQRDTSRK